MCIIKTLSTTYEFKKVHIADGKFGCNRECGLLLYLQVYILQRTALFHNNTTANSLNYSRKIKNFDVTCSFQFGQNLAVLKKEPLSNLCATLFESIFLEPFAHADIIGARKFNFRTNINKHCSQDIDS